MLRLSRLGLCSRWLRAVDLGLGGGTDRMMRRTTDRFSSKLRIELDGLCCGMSCGETCVVKRDKLADFGEGTHAFSCYDGSYVAAMTCLLTCCNHLFTITLMVLLMFKLACSSGACGDGISTKMGKGLETGIPSRTPSRTSQTAALVEADLFQIEMIETGLHT